MTRTILHIGAHKTATTYLQKKLALNQTVLEKHNILYLPLDELRKNVTGGLHDRSKLNEETLSAIRQAVRTRTVILSDENIAGMPGDLVRSGTFYPSIGERARQVCDIININGPDVYFALREYSAFLVSMYCEYLRHNDFMPFEDYHALYRKSGFSWRKVIADILAALPGARLTVWDFGEFRSKENLILSDMLGFEATGFAAPEKQLRASFSQMMMTSLVALRPSLSAADLKRVLPFLARAFPKGDEYPAYSPIAPAGVTAMEAAYAADLARIRQDFPKIRFL